MLVSFVLNKVRDRQTDQRQTDRQGVGDFVMEEEGRRKGGAL